MSLLDLVALTLATGAVLDAWRNSALFETKRAKVEAISGAWKIGHNPRLLWAALLDCGFCLGYHVPLVLALLCLGPAWLDPAHAGFWKLPVYCLAVTRASWLLNSVLRPELRYE